MMDDFIINSIVEFANLNDRVQLKVYCQISEEMQIPTKVRAQFTDQIMFAYNYYADTNIEFDFDTQILSWDTKFGGMPFNIQIPVKDIIAITDSHNSAIEIRKLKNKPQQPPRENPNKESKKKGFKYTLHVNDDPNFKGNKSKADLKIVK